jgi:hypothetical protein
MVRVALWIAAEFARLPDKKTGADRRSRHLVRELGLRCF